MAPSGKDLRPEFEDSATIESVPCPHSDASTTLLEEDEERSLALALHNMEHLDPFKRLIVESCLHPDSRSTRRLAKKLGLTVEELDQAIESVGEELRTMARDCRMPDRAPPAPDGRKPYVAPSRPPRELAARRRPD